MAELLIVDDDPLVREYLAIMGNLDGHACAAAENGAEAIEHMGSHPCDIAIVDIFMPVTEGIETIVEMRRTFPTTKIIAMSAGSKMMPCSQALDFARNLGADEILPEPFSLDIYVRPFRASWHPASLNRDKGCLVTLDGPASPDRSAGTFFVSQALASAERDRGS